MVKLDRKLMRLYGFMWRHPYMAAFALVGWVWAFIGICAFAGLFTARMQIFLAQ